MKFWDSSAIVPLLVPETLSSRSSEILQSDNLMLVWTLTPVECYSALYRRNREKKLDSKSINLFRTRLRQLEDSWTEIHHLESVKQRAERLLAVHPLRAADALQLAAALSAVEENPRVMDFVCFDEVLAEAASREGFVVIGRDS